MLQLRAIDGETPADEKALALLPGMVEAFAVSILEASPDCIKLVDLDGTLSFMNGNGMVSMEIDAFDAVEGRRWSDLWPEESRADLEQAVENARLGRPGRFEGFCPTAKGAPRWWSVTVTPVAGPDGAVGRILASSRDITERVEAERARAAQEIEIEAVNRKLAAELREKTELLERQEVLLAEIDHRVKNSFALISGILRLQMRTLGGGEAREAIEDAANRISTLSKLHDQLHMNPNNPLIALGPYLRSLVDGLSETLSGEGGTHVETDIETDATTPAANAVSIGLIATELVANALKHPRPGRANEVKVSLRHDATGVAELTVSDTGLGLPPGFDLTRSEGLGMKICTIYAEQLGGTMTCGNRLPAGAEFRVRFDLAATA